MSLTALSPFVNPISEIRECQVHRRSPRKVREGFRLSRSDLHLKTSPPVGKYRFSVHAYGITPVLDRHAAFVHFHFYGTQSYLNTKKVSNPSVASRDVTKSHKRSDRRGTRFPPTVRLPTADCLLPTAATRSALSPVAYHDYTQTHKSIV